MNFNFEADLNTPLTKVTYLNAFVTTGLLRYSRKFKSYYFKNSVEYRDVFKGVDVQYQKTENSVKENIIIHSPDSCHDFLIKLDSNLRFRRINDIIVLVDPFNNHPLFKINKLVVLDKDKNIINVPVTNIFNYKAKRLSIKLNPVESDKYPIIVDPTISILPTNISPIKTSSTLDDASVDLDIIAREDSSGSIYSSEHYDKKYRGDVVTFNKSVDLRMNLRGPSTINDDLTDNFDISSISVDSGGAKHTESAPLSKTATIPLQTSVAGQNSAARLIIDPTALSPAGASTSKISVLGDPACSDSGLKIDWKVFYITFLNKLEIFDNDKIADENYIDDFFGSLNYQHSEDPTVLIYKVNPIVQFGYTLFVEATVKNGNDEIQEVLSGFLHVFAGVAVQDQDVYFYLNPEHIHIDRNNQSNEFEVNVIIPSQLYPILGNKIFTWSLKKFESGNISDVTNNTSYGTLRVDVNTTKTIYYTPPIDISTIKDDFFIECSTTYLDKIEKTIKATCVISKSFMEISPAWERPTILPSGNLFRFYNFNLVDSTKTNTALQNADNRNYWQMYGTVQDPSIPTWKVIHPNLISNSSPEIDDLFTNNVGDSPYSLYRPYGGITDRVYSPGLQETVQYTLGSRNEVIEYIFKNQVTPVNSLPERLYLTYSYIPQNGTESDRINLLSILNPTRFPTEVFDARLDKHCIERIAGTSESLSLILSEPLRKLYFEDPERFIIEWSVIQRNSNTDEVTQIDKRTIIRFNEDTDLRITVFSPYGYEDHIFFVITASIYDSLSGDTYSDTCFLLVNNVEIEMDKHLEIPYSSGKRINIFLSERLKNNLSYNHGEDYSEGTKLRLDTLRAKDGYTVVTVNDIINGNTSDYSQFYHGLGFIDFQYPQTLYDATSTRNNRLTHDSSYRLTDHGITLKSAIIQREKFTVFRFAVMDEEEGKYRYGYICVEFVEPVHPTIFPDILFSKLNGLEDKETPIAQTPEIYNKYFFFKQDYSYKMYISNDLDGTSDADISVPLRGYELKVYYYTPEDKIKILAYHSENDSKHGLYDELGLGDEYINRNDVIEGVQWFHFQMPPLLKDDSGITSDNYYNDLYDINDTLPDTLFISVQGDRLDDTVIENTRYAIRRIPQTNDSINKHYVVENPRNGETFDLDPANPNRSLWIVDNILNRQCKPEITPNSTSYMYVISTDVDHIANQGVSDTTPNDEFFPIIDLVGKSYYQIQSYIRIPYYISDNSIRSEGTFVKSSADSHIDIGDLSFAGGFRWSGLLNDFLSKFNNHFEYTYRNDKRLLDGLNSFLIRNKDDLGIEITDGSTLNGQYNYYFQINVFELKSGSLERIQDSSYNYFAHSGTSQYNNQISFIGTPVLSYYESETKSATITNKPFDYDIIKEGSIYSNQYNGDLYVGLVGNGMKYVISDNLKPYEDLVETEGISPTDCDALIARTNFPSYRHSNDRYMAVDYLGIDAPDTDEEALYAGYPTISGIVVDSVGTPMPDMKITFEENKSTRYSNVMVSNLILYTDSNGRWSTNGFVNGIQKFKTVDQQRAEGKGFKGYRVRIQYYGNNFPNDIGSYGFYEDIAFIPRNAYGAAITFYWSENGATPASGNNFNFTWKGVYDVEPEIINPDPSIGQYGYGYGYSCDEYFELSQVIERENFVGHLSEIPFPDTVTKFLAYFDPRYIQYHLFAGTTDGLYCFYDFDIYGKYRTLNLPGLCRRIWDARIFAPCEVPDASNYITDIQLLFPTSDIMFSTKDSVYFLSQYDITILQNPETNKSNLWHYKIRPLVRNVSTDEDCLHITDIKEIKSMVRIARGDTGSYDGGILNSGAFVAGEPSILQQTGCMVTYVDYDGNIKSFDLFVESGTKALFHNDSRLPKISNTGLDGNTPGTYVPKMDLNYDPHQRTSTFGFMPEQDGTKYSTVGGSPILGALSYGAVGQMHKQADDDSVWSDTVAKEATSSVTGATSNVTIVEDQSGIHEEYLTTAQPLMCPHFGFIPYNQRANNTPSFSIATENSIQVYQEASFSYNGSPYWWIFNNLYEEIPVSGTNLTYKRKLDHVQSQYSLLEIERVEDTDLGIVRSLVLRGSKAVKPNGRLWDLPYLVSLLHAWIAEPFGAPTVKPPGVNKEIYYQNEAYLLCYRALGYYYIYADDIRTQSNIQGLTFNPPENIYQKTNIVNSFKSNFEYVLVKHTPLIDIFINEDATDGIVGDPRRIDPYWRGRSFGAWFNRRVPGMLLENVPVKSTPDNQIYLNSDGADRPYYMPGLTHYDGGKEDLGSPTITLKQSISGNRFNYLTNTETFHIDNRGVVLFAYNGTNPELNFLAGTELDIMGGRFFVQYMGRKIIKQADEGGFLSSDPADDLLRAGLHERIFRDYLKVMHYISRRRSASSIYPYNYFCVGNDYSDVNNYEAFRSRQLQDLSIKDMLFGLEGSPISEEEASLLDLDQKLRQIWDSDIWADPASAYKINQITSTTSIYWAWDGIYTISDGGELSRFSSKDKAFPFFFQYQPSIFFQESNIVKNYYNDNDSKIYFISHITLKNGKYLYSLRVRSDSSEYEAGAGENVKNNIYIQYANEKNYSDKHFPTRTLSYDLKEMFPYDYEKIGTISGLEKYGDIIATGYAFQTYDQNLFPKDITEVSGKSVLANATTIQVSPTLYNSYRIKDIPPGLFGDMEYIVVPRSKMGDQWQYFYHPLRSSTDNTEYLYSEIDENGAVRRYIDGLRAEFVRPQELQDSINNPNINIFQTVFQTANNLTNGLDLDPSSVQQSVYNFSVYSPAFVTTFAWAGESHFGIILGDPDNHVKYLID